MKNEVEFNVWGQVVFMCLKESFPKLKGMSFEDFLKMPGVENGMMEGFQNTQNPFLFATQTRDQLREMTK